MEFPLPQEIVANSVFRALRNDLENLRQQIDAARPFSDAVVKRISLELTRDRVHQSNAIEGNTLSLRETTKILEAGQLIDVGRKRESMEALNLGKAITEIQCSIDSKKSYADQALFVSVHKTLFTELQDDIAGRYRVERVILQGAKHQPPREPEKYLGPFFESLSESTGLDPVLLAAWAHWAIARIHPFVDGNGRMSRLWQDFVLLSHHFPPAIIPFSQRNEYYQALTEADEGQFDSLLQLVVRSAIRTSQSYLTVIREQDEALPWAQALVRESEQELDDKLELEYVHWSERVRELREALQRCIVLLNRSAQLYEFELNEYDPISRSTWELSRSEPQSTASCFRIVVQATGKRFAYLFIVGRHVQNAADTPLNLHGPQVNLLIGEMCGSQEAVLLQGANCPVSLREILVHEGALVCGRWDRMKDKLVYDQNCSYMKVAQQFLEEVIRSRLTV